MIAGKRYLEKAIATTSFVVAVALAFTSMLISKDHDVAANICLVIAQFLTLTATLLGIDYKFHGNTATPERPAQLQSS